MIHTYKQLFYLKLPLQPQLQIPEKQLSYEKQKQCFAGQNKSLKNKHWTALHRQLLTSFSPTTLPQKMC